MACEVAAHFKFRSKRQPSSDCWDDETSEDQSSDEETNPAGHNTYEVRAEDEEGSQRTSVCAILLQRFPLCLCVFGRTLASYSGGSRFKSQSRG